MPKTSPAVLITEHALIQRINRKIWADDLMVKKTRGARALVDLGYYYVLDWRNPNVIEHHADLEGYARELGVLKPYEGLAS